MVRLLRAIGSLLLLVACGDEPDEPGAPRPLAAAVVPRDVVLLTLDTLRADRLGCYGNPRGLTPNLDRLAREGARFANAMAPMPCTAPAHAALFTGLSPRLNGCTSNFLRAGDGLLTIAERLQALGFATGAVFNAFNFAEINLVQGFDGFGFDKGRRAERVIPTFEQFLAANRERRRFAWLHLFIPHGPHDFPDEYARFVTHRYDGPLTDDFHSLEQVRIGAVDAPPEFAARYRDRYDAAVAFTDARVGELRAALERAGSWDRTLLIVVADHGESLEGRTLGFHAPVIAESTLHVPMIWRGPGVPAGVVVEPVVQHVDLVPSLLAALGELLPADVEGRDFTPLIAAAGGGAEVDWERPAIATLPTHFEGKAGADPEAGAVRSGRFKLILREGQPRQLFDVVADPGETRDVIADHPAAARALEAAFEEWVRATATAAAAADNVSSEMAAQLRKLGYQ